MAKELLFTKQDVERFGFKFEPDASKCDNMLLYGVYNKYDKQLIASKIPTKYVYCVFAENGKIFVRGHSSIDLL